MKTAKRFLSVLLSLCLVLGLIPGTAFAASGNLPFTDVNTTDWYHDAVQYAYDKGMMSGTSATTFAPNETTSRGMIVTVLHRMEGMPTASGAVFTDVSSGQWYANAVAWANANNIVGGYGNGLFGPSDAITREQMSSILYRYSQYKGYPVSTSGSLSAFPDAAQTSSYAVDAMNWAVGSGLIAGVSGNLAPKGSATRAQVATILQRYCENVVPASTPELDTSIPDTTPSTVDATYTVTFDLNYGSDTQYEKKTVKEGETVSKPSNPNRSGYSFNGWYTEKSGGSQYDFKKEITSDLTLYAHWSRRSSSSGGGGGYNPIIPPPNVPAACTRGEWINLLVDTYGYPECDTDENFYNDIAESEYASEINRAVAYNILPSNGGAFKPNDATTREFAAVTAIRSMGYAIPETAIDCTDVAEIAEPQAAYLAVDLGLLALENGMYYPDRALKKDEADHIMAILEETYYSTTVNDGEGKGYGFLENVTQLGPVEVQDVDDDTIRLPLSSELSDLQEGEIVVNGTESAYKVSSVEYTDTSVEITYTTPELHEFLDYIDIQGEGYLDYSQFIPADGVSVTHNSAQTPQTRAWYDGVVSVPDTDINLDIDLVLEGEIDMGGGWKTKYELEFGLPSASYKVDVDFNPISGILPGGKPVVDVRNVYLKIEENAGVTVNIGNFADDVGLLNDPFFKEVTLGYVPLVGTDGFGALVEVNLVLNAQGSIEFQYNVAGVLGCQVLNNHPRNLSALDSSASLGVTGEIKIGPQLYVVAEVFDKDIISFGADAGARLGGEVAVRSTGMICVDGSLSAYAELSAFDRCLLDDWLDISMKWTIWDEHNSPLKGGFHFENMVKVPECTYENSAIIRGTVADAEDRDQYIGNAKIEVCHFSTGDVVSAVYSDAEGRYSVVVPAGSYDLHISADGYAPSQVLRTVSEKQDIFVETFLTPEEQDDTNSATIRGTVANAENRTQYIENAKVEVRRSGTGNLVATEYTDVNGRYSVAVPSGSYDLNISANGYIPFQSLHTVSENEEIFVETFLMVEGEEGTNETGTIGGHITNAVNGSSIEDVQLTIRKGWNQTEGEVVASVHTNDDGSYSVQLPLGNYTIQMEKSGYISNHLNVAVTRNDNHSWHGVLNPSEESTIPTGDLRIVLTWGEYPYDLDSHLWGPTTDGTGRFHIAFYDMDYREEDTLHAFLDLDDTSSYGPETTTIYSMSQSGNYSFYVHDYSNSGDETNTAMANSGARVVVYVDDEIVATYHIPTYGVGDVWHVFDFDADTRQFTPVNTFTTVGAAELVGASATDVQEHISIPAKTK